MDLATPSRFLGWTHLVLLALLCGTALGSARPVTRRLLLGGGWGLVLLLPLLWVGPFRPQLWQSDLARRFYLAYFLGLAIPFALASGLALVLDRRRLVPRPAIRLAAVFAGYLLGLTLSFPVSVNYALLYPLIR